MNVRNEETARAAVADAERAVRTAVQVLASHYRNHDTHPGREEAADSLGRALTEVSEARQALAVPTVPATTG